MWKRRAHAADGAAPDEAEPAHAAKASYSPEGAGDSTSSGLGWASIGVAAMVLVVAILAVMGVFSAPPGDTSITGTPAESATPELDAVPMASAEA